jgi:hypothetical protein
MSDKGTSSTSMNTNERYALARHGLPLSGRVAAPLRAHWLPATIKNRANLPPQPSVAPAIVDDSNSMEDWWSAEVSELNIADDESGSMANSIDENRQPDEGAIPSINAERRRSVPADSNNDRNNNRDHHAYGVDADAFLATNSVGDTRAFSAIDQRDAMLQGVVPDSRDRDISTSDLASVRSDTSVLNTNLATDVRDMAPSAILDARSATVVGIQRKGRVFAPEADDAAIAATIDQIAMANDEISGGDGHERVAADAPSTTTQSLEDRAASTISASAKLSDAVSSRVNERSDRANRSETAAEAKTRLGSSDSQPKRDNDISARTAHLTIASSPSPYARTVEMGMPSASSPRPDTHASSLNRLIARPAIDAAQIASLLAPAAASAGPRVTIDRVQVTVQAPQSPKPAADQAQSPLPSSQSSAMSRGYSGTLAYRSPWASYFIRRD